MAVGLQCSPLLQSFSQDYKTLGQAMQFILSFSTFDSIRLHSEKSAITCNMIPFPLHKNVKIVVTSRNNNRKCVYIVLLRLLH